MILHKYVHIDCQRKEKTDFNNFSEQVLLISLSVPDVFL